MSRVEQFEDIRKDHSTEGMSVRSLAGKYHVHRRKVRQALQSAVPPERKVPDRESPALGEFKPIIRAWLEADEKAPRKQRHTAHRIWQRLTDEHGARIAESTVRSYVAEVRFELDNVLARVTVPQQHEPGEEAEVDFGEFWCTIAGVPTKLWIFCMRLSASGRGFHVAFSHQAQEAFLEGHVLAFEHFGGVPRRIRYDNLKAAVVRVMFGRFRQETDRFVALRSHYGFDSFYCLPGIEGAHEKGGVEGEIGRFRRNHLVPVPAVGSLSEINEILASADLSDDDRFIARRTQTVGEEASAELPHLVSLPGSPFDAVTLLTAKVDTKGRICVRQSLYSVPVRLARRQVTVRLGASRLEVVHEGKSVAHHLRSLSKGTENLILDHYLEILVRKPGALPGSTALAQARSSGAFGPVHEQFWSLARRQLGDGAGTRALISVLLLHRRYSQHVVEEAIASGLSTGSVDPELVVIEARRLTEQRPGCTGDPPRPHRPRPTHTPHPRRLRRTSSSWQLKLTVTEQAADACIHSACLRLHLPTVRSKAGGLADQAARQSITHRGYLAEVLAAEVDHRDVRRKSRLVHEARFPRLKRLDEFDLSAAPTVNPATLAVLAKGAWIQAGEPVVLLGDSGTGKSHILIGLGVAACEAGRRVRYLTCAALVNELAEAADERMLSKVVARYGRLDLLCLDEVGYISIDPRGAELLFQVITEREEKASIAVASNAPFSEWGSTFSDPRLAAAVVDRLTFRAHIIQTGTNSYRLGTARSKALSIEGGEAAKT